MPDVNNLPQSSQQDIDFWKKFEGQLLDGQFPLDGYLSHTRNGAVFLSRLSEQETPALVKLVLRDTPSGARFSAGSALAKDCRHPNLVRVHASGSASLDGLRVAYAVTDQPDANLSDVLQERSLTEEEGREVLLSCAEALQYLHANGLAHTQIDPSAIVSVNETIQLWTDHLAKPAEFEAARANDIAALGGTMVHVLTGKPFNQQGTPDLKAAYAGIIRSCLVAPASRNTARQIVKSLKNPTPAPERVLPMPRFEPPPELRPASTSVAKYAIPAVLMVLLGGAWLVSRPTRSVTTPAKQLAQGDVDRSLDPAREISKPAAAPVVTPAPVVPKPAPAVAPPPATTGAQNWLVVVYTYTQPGAAEHKAAEINRKWPELHARVFAPKGDSPHLVVLGNGMDREQASQLRRRAIASRLPRDSYIQNF